MRAREHGVTDLNQRDRVTEYTARCRANQLRLQATGVRPRAQARGNSVMIGCLGVTIVTLEVVTMTT